MSGILFDDVTKKFDEKIVLKNASFQAENGITLLISPNGTGKSTIIYLLMGNYRPNSGKIRVNGYDPVKNHRNAFINTSLMTEYPVYFGSGYVSDFIETFAMARNIAKREIVEYLDYFNITYILSDKIGRLSMGESQLMYISCYLSGNFNLYVFDEPNSNLDQENRKKFAYAIKTKYENTGATFLITSHINDELSNYATNILTVKNEQVISHLSDVSSYAFMIKYRYMEKIPSVLDKFEYFIYKNYIIIKNAHLMEIIEELNEQDIIEILRISGPMIDYYENEK